MGEVVSALRDCAARLCAIPRPRAPLADLQALRWDADASARVAATAAWVHGLPDRWSIDPDFGSAGPVDLGRLWGRVRVGLIPLTDPLELSYVPIAPLSPARQARARETWDAPDAALVLRHGGRAWRVGVDFETPALPALVSVVNHALHDLGAKRRLGLAQVAAEERFLVVLSESALHDAVARGLSFTWGDLLYRDETGPCVRLLREPPANPGGAAAALALASGWSAVEAAAHLDRWGRETAVALASGAKVRLGSLGVLTTTRRRGGRGRDPATGQTVDVPPRTVPQLRVGAGVGSWPASESPLLDRALADSVEERLVRAIVAGAWGPLGAFELPGIGRLVRRDAFPRVSFDEPWGGEDPVAHDGGCDLVLLGSPL